MDTIQIRDLEIYCHHGVFKEENVLGQKFLVSLALYMDTRPAGEADDLSRSINYAEVAYLYGDYKYTSLLQDRQAVAEAMKKGIWDLDKKEKWISKQESDDEDHNDLTIKEILVIIAILILGYFYKNMVKKLNKYKKKVLKK